MGSSYRRIVLPLDRPTVGSSYRWIVLRWIVLRWICLPRPGYIQNQRSGYTPGSGGKDSLYPEHCIPISEPFSVSGAGPISRTRGPECVSRRAWGSLILSGSLTPNIRDISAFCATSHYFPEISLRKCGRSRAAEFRPTDRTPWECVNLHIGGRSCKKVGRFRTTHHKATRP